ncbi:MAG: T9SS type A sorting domain-containing protein [candidate division KSB1 bacterium]|nr:T9SS type A sorting domain-containing protein [candidate division KSB1 bacterium]MDZ7305115.1 T9SS type A sorting domain-containing protein [candidate division KSB1 bacterium]MDZ7314184.1 T9SS type A sorting domain-containing protein [candidate division KSB1 bacterium]
MKTTTFAKIALTGVLILVCTPDIAKGQPAKEPSRKEALIISSGTHDGKGEVGTEPRLAFKGVARVFNAPWLRLYFGNSELGHASFLKITSLEDRAYQYLNSVSLKQWQNSSAFFNGDGVEVELYIAPEDKGIFFEIKEVVVGERPANLGKINETSQAAGDPCDPIVWCGICGNTDDRVPSNDRAILRMTRIRAAYGDTVEQCTGWIASNGAYLAAGHCFRDTDVRILEFNVPKSDPDGTINFPHPNDQYTIDATSVVREDLGVGRDWAIFKCYPNSNTGLLPVQAQDAFYRLSLDSTPPTFHLTGYGRDECPPGTNPQTQRNSDNATQQTDTGPNNNPPTYGDIGSGNYVYWTYCIDHRTGNSGGPVIPEGTNLSVGIVSHCIPIAATSFDCDALENAINVFPGSNIVYADNGHSFATGAGTVFRPYNTVAGAVNAVPAGGIVSIVKGSYNESMTINKAMTITAPVGNVTIGPSGPPKIAESSFDPYEKGRQNESVPTEYSLSQNYPNPFNPETTIEYTLPKPSFVKLEIYDMLGQEVRTLVSKFQQAGVKSVVWDGKNNQGQLVPSGLYIYRIVADGFAQSSKSVLLK